MTTNEQLGILAVLGLVVAWLLFPRKPATAAGSNPSAYVAPTTPYAQPTYSPPPAAPPPASLPYVAPATGPATEARSGRGHF